MSKIIITTFVFLLLTACNSNKETGPIAERISHRGYNDNKMDGFIAAITDGYNMLETDVRLRDEIPILLHNNDERCSDCNNLSALLELAQKSGVKLFIEFKEFKAISPSLKLISQYNVDVVLTSFNKEHLIYLNTNANYSLGFITEDSFELSELPPIDYLLINRQYVNKCPEEIVCVAWGVHSKKQFNSIKYKVDFAITDQF